jgi:thioredoxin reductase (NADPH)
MNDAEKSGSGLTTPDPGTDPYLSPELDAGQLALLGRWGTERLTTAGQLLIREGDRGADFMVVLSGTVAVFDYKAGVERVIATLGPGRFLNELNILTGERMFAGGVVREPGSVLVVPVDRLQEVIARDQELADLILQALLRRRQWMLQHQAGMQIVGSRSSTDFRRLREFAARNRMPHTWVDLDADAGAGAVLAETGLGPDDAPVVLMRGGEVLRNPSNWQLARAAGFGAEPLGQQAFEVAVVGAGPAGLAASVYGASEGMATAVLDGTGVGGQIGTTSRIENYLGFPVGVSGEEFAQRAMIQVLRFGARLLVPATAVGLTRRSDGYLIRLDSGGQVTARTVIIATGVTYRQLDAAGLDRFEGTGVFCTPLASQDQVMPGDPVVIVGGGNSAGQAATWLADHGHPVTVVVRGEGLAATMSQYLVDRVARNPAITICTRHVVRGVDGAGRLERVTVEDLTTSARRTVAAGALFVLIGAEAHTQWLAGSIELDSHGFIVTGPDLSGPARAAPAWEKVGRDPYLLEASLPGVFAVGDVRSGSVKRVGSAVGEGSIAIRPAIEHLHRMAAMPVTGPSARA